MSKKLFFLEVKVSTVFLNAFFAFPDSPRLKSCKIPDM